MFVERVLRGDTHVRNILGQWDKEHDWYCERFLRPEILRGLLAGMPLEDMEVAIKQYSEQRREMGFEYGLLREALKASVDTWISKGE